MPIVRSVGVWVCGGAMVFSVAQAETSPPLQNVVQLSASAHKEAPQDWLTMALVARHQASDAATVQNQLKATLEKALTRARAKAVDKGLQVHSGLFSVQPRHGKDGQIVGWQGSAELLLQGRDVARISSLAAELPDMSVSQMGFSLSPEAVQALESEVRQNAMANFRATAQEVAKGFGFASWTLREVTVQAGADTSVMARPVLMRAPAMVASGVAPVPVEPGRSVVQVSVSGSIQLR